MKTVFTEKDKTAVKWFLIFGGITLTIFVLTRFIRPIIVSGESMEPSFHNGEWLIGFPSVKYEYGEVIVINTDGKCLIKRIIGLPGDTITIRNGSVYRNGERIEEPYVMGITVSKGTDTVILSDNEVYALGDNREHSKDSRVYGAFDKSQILFHIPT